MRSQLLLLISHHPPEKRDHVLFPGFGRYRIPICARCTGIVLGILTGIILCKYIMNISLYLDNIFIYSFLILFGIASAAGFLINWAIPYMTDLSVSRLSRTISGLFCGMSLGILFVTKLLILRFMVVESILFIFTVKTMYMVEMGYGKIVGSWVSRFMGSKRFDISCSIIFLVSGIVLIIRTILDGELSLFIITRTVLVFVLHLLIAYLFLVRDVSEYKSTLKESIVPIVSFTTPIFIIYSTYLLDPTFRFDTVGMILVIFGMGITIISLFNLGRSFGILPSRRKIITKGFYSLIRPPSYAGEMIIGIGLVLAFFNFLTLTILLIGIIATLLRILIEERVLSKEKDYMKYKGKVRYRVIPLVW